MYYESKIENGSHICEEVTVVSVAGTILAKRALVKSLQHVMLVRPQNAKMTPTPPIPNPKDFLGSEMISKC